MLRVHSLRCPSWDSSALAKAFNLPCQQSRTAATFQQKKQPSRMTLSARVAKGPPNETTAGGKPVRRTRNSPFGGMNVTQAPRQLQYQKNKISAAELKRQTRAFPKFGKVKDEKTRDPMRALKMQRRLADVSYEKRTKIKQDILERDSFDDFALSPIVKDCISSQALGGMVDISPTPIQRLAIPALLGTGETKRKKSKSEVAPAKNEMQQFLLAAETGSGKTLAYVLPIIDAMKRAELAEAAQAKEDAIWKAQVEREKRNRAPIFELETPVEEEEHSSAGRPKVIILLPTAELVAQVGALVKSMSHTVKYRAALISAAVSGTIIRNRMFAPSGVDVVIATPHLLNSITESDPNVLSRVTHLVIDEADSLLDRGFSPITSSIIDRAAPSLQQLVFCSATIPRSMDAYLEKRYPDVNRLVTPNLHAIPRRVQLSVIDIEKVPYQGNRDLACAQTIWDIDKEAAESGDDKEKKIVVFVNEREKTIELANYLRSKGIDAGALSRDSDERKLAQTLADFTGTSMVSKKPDSRPRSEASTADSAGDLAEMQPNPAPKSEASPKNRGQTTRFTPPASVRQLNNTKVLVMTDIGSRGIDTLLVKHVILYDVPHTSIDFIHRLGRVGRMGRRGRGIVLVGKHDRKDVVREVREGMFKGQALI